MGRFYQTSDAKFVDDKMFEAPHQLMAQVLQNKDKEIDNELANYDLLQAKILELKGHKEDDPLVKQKLEYYQNKYDNGVKEVLNNPLGNHSQFINSFKKELLTDYSNGDISKILNNNASYIKRQEAIKTNNQLNEEQKAVQYEFLENEYKGGILANKNINNDYIDPSLKFDLKGTDDLKAQYWAKKRDNMNAGNPLTTITDTAGNEITAKRIQESAYAALRNDTNNQKAASHYGKYIPNMGDTDIDNAFMKDENGKELLEKDGSKIPNLNNYYGKIIYSKTKDLEIHNVTDNNKTHSLNELWKITYDERIAKRSAKAEEIQLRAGKDASSQYLQSRSSIDYRENYIDELAKKAGVKNANDITLPDLRNFVLGMGNTNNAKLLLNQIDNIDETVKSKMVASYKPMENWGYNPATITKLQEDIHHFFKTKGNTVAYKLDLEGVTGGNTQKISNPKGTTNQEKKAVTPKELENRSILVPGTQKRVVIKKAYVVEDSSTPILINQNILNNDIQSTVRIEWLEKNIDDPLHPTTRFFDVDAYSEMSKDISIIR